MSRTVCLLIIGKASNKMEASQEATAYKIQTVTFELCSMRLKTTADSRQWSEQSCQTPFITSGFGTHSRKFPINTQNLWTFFRTFGNQNRARGHRSSNNVFTITHELMMENENNKVHLTTAVNRNPFTVSIWHKNFIERFQRLLCNLVMPSYALCWFAIVLDMWCTEQSRCCQNSDNLLPLNCKYLNCNQANQ